MSEAARFDQLQQLTREASELLGLPPDNERVVLLASLRLAHTIQIERMVHGATVDPNALLNVTDAIARLSPGAPVPSIKLTFVEGITGICPKCNARIDNYEKPKPPPSPPVVIDREVIERGDGSTAMAALSAPVEAKAEPPTRRHPGSTRDQPRVPLKRYDEPWRGYGRTS